MGDTRAPPVPIAHEDGEDFACAYVPGMIDHARWSEVRGSWEVCSHCVTLVTKTGSVPAAWRALMNYVAVPQAPRAFEKAQFKVKCALSTLALRCSLGRASGMRLHKDIPGGYLYAGQFRLFEEDAVLDGVTGVLMVTDKLFDAWEKGRDADGRRRRNRLDALGAGDLALTLKRFNPVAQDYFTLHELATSARHLGQLLPDDAMTVRPFAGFGSAPPTIAERITEPARQRAPLPEHRQRAEAPSMLLHADNDDWGGDARPDAGAEVIVGDAVHRESAGDTTKVTLKSLPTVEDFFFSYLTPYGSLGTTGYWGWRPRRDGGDGDVSWEHYVRIRLCGFDERWRRDPLYTFILQVRAIARPDPPGDPSRRGAPAQPLTGALCSQHLSDKRVILDRYLKVIQEVVDIAGVTIHRSVPATDAAAADHVPYERHHLPSVVPATLRGSARYWNSAMKDLYAISEAYGPPTLFLTLTMSEYNWLRGEGDAAWSLPSSCSHHSQCPVEVVREFWNRCDQGCDHGCTSSR